MRSLVALQVPKSDHGSSPCEDAWSLQAPGEPACGSHALALPAWDRLPRILRVAVSDGASTSSGSARWASLLCLGSVAFEEDWARDPEGADWLRTSRSAWQSASEGELGTDAPWYARTALALGAHATLLVLRLDGALWQALAIGDTNLFQVREGRPCLAFPLEQPAFFDQAPDLVSSRGSRGGPNPPVRRMEGSLEPGDVLILATDALARFLMEQDAWSWALSLLGDPSPEARFLDAVQKGRANRQLKDDDTTLVLLRPSICSGTMPAQDCPPATPAEC